MANAFSCWVARRIYPMLVKVDMDSKEIRQYNEVSSKVRAVWRKRRRLYKRYGITVADIEKEVEQKFNALQKIARKAALGNGRKSIQKAIQERRIVFNGEDAIHYIDKDNKEFDYTFAEMAHRCVDNVGQRDNMALYLGIFDSSFQEILEDEYKKQK